MLYFTLTFYRNTKNRINCLGKIQSNINIYYIVKQDKGLYRMPGFLQHTYILNIFLATHTYIYIYWCNHGEIWVTNLLLDFYFQWDEIVKQNINVSDHNCTITDDQNHLAL